MNKPGTVVLVVGEGRAWRMPLVRALQRGGYLTLEASDGFEALSAAVHQHIDVLISGDKMAGFSGRDLIGIVIRHNAIPRCIFVSESPEEAKGLPGGVTFLRAPFQLQELLGKVEGYVTRPI